MTTYYQKHKEEQLKKVKEYQKTKIGKATKIMNDCKKNDRKHGRGEGDLTAEWIVENIFSKPCAHCGETDWRKIGCNRLDNTKPHTMDNVEPCCWECNNKLGHECRKKKVYQFTIEGELVAVWECAKDAADAIRCSNTTISDCCRGELKTCKGYIWKYLE